MGIEVFVNMITNPTLNIMMTILVILLGFGVCAMGLQGVERITKVMMLLFLLVMGSAIYALTLPGAGKGLAFYFIPTRPTRRSTAWAP